MSENIGDVISKVQTPEDVLFKCSSCSETKKDMKLFPCFHSLCEQCYVIEDNEHMVVQCKLCPEKYFSDEIDPTHLSDNFFANEYNMMLEILEKSRSGILCEDCCLPKPKEAEAFCFDCNRFMCRADMKAHLTVTQSYCDVGFVHLGIDLPDLKLKDPIQLMHYVKDRIIKCSTHTYRSEYYCLEDELWVCNLCRAGHHNSHTLFSDKEITERWMDDLLKTQEKFHYFANENSVNKDEIRAIMTEQKEKENEVVSHIEGVFNELIKKIEEKKINTINEARKKYEMQYDVLNAKLVAIESSMERIQTAKQFIDFSVQLTDKHFLKEASFILRSYGDALHCQNLEKDYMPDVTMRLRKSIDEYVEDFCVLKENDALSAPEVCFGNFGPGVDQFKMISDVTVDKQGRIHVVDSQAYSVKIFTPDGKFLSQVGKRGEDQGQFMRPWGICTKDDYIYVSDYIRHNVQMFDIEGKFIKAVGKSGVGKNHFKEPRGMEAEDEVYICDKLNNRIQVYSLNLEFLYTLGLGVKLNQPRDIAMSNHSLVVLCSGSPCINVILKTDEFQYTFGEKGPGLPLSDPWFIAADENSCIVTDTKSNAILRYSINGDLNFHFNRHGDYSGSICQPNGIYLDARGMLVIGESGNCRIQVLKPV
ncbi:Tripartite motif-containing protein 2-like [Oopsacas minuta]|uniref:Tripartite motif-containing protein 2-like n=1 Tax=Oopsacas minuta TaxID=111878 RepID=A0AAV7K6J0_9METZ|nr:Tripartite motif-containing protein 2-like [Oopsacas minuta]